MRRMTLMIVWILAMTFTIAVVSQAAGVAKSGSLEQVQSVKNTGASQTSTTKIYWKNDGIRIEQYTPNGLSIEIVKGRTMYSYIPDQKSAMCHWIPRPLLR